MTIEEIIDDWCKTSFPDGIPPLTCHKCGKPYENLTCPNCGSLLPENQGSIVARLGAKFGWFALGVLCLITALAMPFFGWWMGHTFGGRVGGIIGILVGFSAMGAAAKEGFSYLFQTSNSQMDKHLKNARRLTKAGPELKRLAAWSYANCLLYPRAATRLSLAKQGSMFGTIERFEDTWKTTSEEEFNLRRTLLDLLAVELIYYVILRPDSIQTVFDDQRNAKAKLRNMTRDSNLQIAFAKNIIKHTEPNSHLRKMAAEISKHIYCQRLSQELRGIDTEAKTSAQSNESKSSNPAATPSTPANEFKPSNLPHEYNSNGFCIYCGWERSFIVKTGRLCNDAPRPKDNGLSS